MENGETVLENLHDSEAKLLSKIIIASKENNLTWYSNDDSRRKIANLLSISDIRVKQLLTSLTLKGVLIKLSKGVYKVSAKYFTVGKL